MHGLSSLTKGPGMLLELEQMGVHVSDGGLDRLLGAPIGTSAFCIQPGGHTGRIGSRRHLAENAWLVSLGRCGGS